MTYVLDASAMFFACLKGTEYDRLMARDLLAPALMWSETCSSLHQAMSRGAVPRADAHVALDRLRSAPVRLVNDRDLLGAAFDVADQLGWAKTYDAEYVALAGIEGVPLITVDERLRRGAERLVKVVGPTELG